MAFDGIVTKSIVKELNQFIINGKINKIYEPNKSEILLGIYSNGKNYLLNISTDFNNYRINLTTHTKSNPQNPYNFCMVLRKHLIGSSIKNIYMNGLERVVYIDFDCYNELNDLVQKTLIVELMGKHSNIILVNDKNIIIDSIKHLNKLENSIRDVFPGSPYTSIENNKISFYALKGYDDFNTIINNTITLDKNSSISSLISNTFAGIASNNLSYICNELNIDDNNNKEISINVFNYLYSIVNNLKSQNMPINFVCKMVKDVKYNNKIKNDYYIGLSEDYSDLQVNFFIDDFYDNKEKSEFFTNSKNNALKYVLELLKKLNSKLNVINSKLDECKDLEKYKLYGELITSNLYKIPNYNVSEITLSNYYDNNNSITIKLDNSITPSNNAKKFFKKYRKLQNTALIVSKQKELMNTEISYLETIISDIDNSSSIDEINDIYNELHSNLNIEIKGQKNNKSDSNFTKGKSSNMPSIYNIDGFAILIGKNNKQNDMLTCKIAKNNDLWFHTKDIHGSHVVLRLEKSIEKYDRSKIDSIIYKCATYAAFYSKAKLSSNVPVDYTLIKYVKKPNSAKPGMVIYTNNKTLYVNPKEPNNK